MNILEHPAVVALKKIALALMQNAAETGGPPGTRKFTFPEAWSRAFGSHADLNAAVMKTGYVIVPRADGTLGYVPPQRDGSDSSTEPAVNLDYSVSGIREGMAKQNLELAAIVRARQAATGLDFHTCWNAVLKERPDLRQVSSDTATLEGANLPPEVKAWTDQFVEKDPQGKRLRSMKRAADCAAAVKEVQKNRPNLSFAEAWGIAQSENPELFAGEAEQKSITASGGISERCDAILAKLDAIEGRSGSVKVIGIRQDI